MADLCHQYDVAYASNWSHTWINPDPVPEWLDWITGDIPGGPHGAIQASMRVRFDNTQGIPHDLMTWDYTSPDVWGDPAVKPYAKGYGQLLQEVAVSLAGGAIWHSWTSRSLPAALWPIADFVHEREELFLGSSSVPEVALLHSAATYYIHSRGYMTFNPQELISIYYPGDAYLRGAHRALAESGIHFDIINEENLRPRLAEYPLVVLAEQTHLSPETIEALREYVRQGGIILATGRTACADEIDTALADVLGITIQGPIDEPEGFLVVDPALIDEPSDLADVGPALLSLEADWQRVQPQGAEVVAEFYPTTPHSSGLQRPDFTPGAALPAVTVNRFGEGRAVYMACDVFRAYETTCYYGVRRYIDTLLRRARPQRTVEIQAPFYVEVFVRRQPGCTLVHLVNKGLIAENPAKGRQFEQVAPTGAVEVRLRLPRAPSRVTLEPEGLVPEHTYQEGLLAVALPQIEGVLASIVAWD